MDIVLFFLCTWWIAGILGLRPRRTRRRRKRRTYWKPNVSPYDYEEYLRRNAR